MDYSDPSPDPNIGPVLTPVLLCSRQDFLDPHSLAVLLLLLLPVSSHLEELRARGRSVPFLLMEVAKWQLHPNFSSPSPGCPPPLPQGYSHSLVLVGERWSLALPPTWRGGTKLSEPSKNSGMNPKVTGFLSPELTEPNSLSEIFPIMEPIAAPEPACDDKSGRLEMIGLYNGMCRVVEAGRPDALQAYFGVRSASSRLSNNISDLETIYEDVCRVLTVPNPGTSMEGLDVQSVKGNEILNGGLLSTFESDPKLTAAVEIEFIGSKVDAKETIITEDV
ncbi:hypothetical protein KSP39_PZI019394 [Platanthera zijinensis]|uniref:Uncharacterized protein n=1 Tax=Platanthera zijinensis TaxID=2320716 RepID=A0AAP0B128_9ASPA